MGDLKEIDTAQQVDRAGEPMLKVPREVAEVDELELAAAEQIAEALAVFAAILFLWCERLARLIRLGVRERSWQDLAVSGDDHELDALQRQPVPRFDRAPARAGDLTVLVPELTAST